MDRFLNLNLPTFSRRAGAAALALCFFLGLLSGTVFSVLASDSLYPTMRAAAISCVSISGLLSAILLPFLCSALAVYIKQPRLLLGVAFLKAFTFSYLGWGVTAAFGSAGWLVRCLMMFSDGCALPLLCWYWLRHISSEDSFTVGDAAAVLIVLLVIGSLDYYIISPFLANLF